MYELSQEYQQQLQQQQQSQLRQFWAEQRSEIEQATDMKNHLLPLSRIKKIMRADEDVHMISAEAPALVAKACEMFTLEMTMRDETMEQRVLLPRTEQQPIGAGAYAYHDAPQQHAAGASTAYGGPSSTYVWQEPEEEEQGHLSTYVWQEPQQRQDGP
ncbi:hypothetical protein ZWY2020_006702 [Hordeum vulgare]|nr:hypothetical protein ZWY2020_006702 [Hordeum vulgare]